MTTVLDKRQGGLLLSYLVNIDAPIFFRLAIGFFTITASAFTELVPEMGVEPTKS